MRAAWVGIPEAGEPYVAFKSDCDGNIQIINLS